MMRLEQQLLLAFLLDQLLGDPRWLPHPVRLIGDFAAGCESLFRKLCPPRLAGVLSVIAVLVTTAMAVFALLEAASRLHPLAGEAMAVFLLYTTIAARDLARHSRKVYEALKEDDLDDARRKVALIVGRDTANLDREGVARAAVESVAESMVDGVTAPLFFAAIGGPVGALLYKAVNTMDSMFGYKNERYKQFGWAAARLDDLVNFIPARFTAPLLPVAAAILRLDYKNAWRILRRDRLNHKSPNSGHTEAATAGALGIQLGGPNFYFGKLVDKPAIGDPLQPISEKHILRANLLMLAASILTLGILISLRLLASSLAGAI